MEAVHEILGLLRPPSRKAVVVVGAEWNPSKWSRVHSSAM